jgi:hypothetical protein
LGREDNFDFGSPGSATVQLSVHTEDPGHCVSPRRNSALVHLECMSFVHDVRCTLRLVLWVLVFCLLGERGQKGGGAGWEIWIEGRRVCGIISWTSNNNTTAPFLLGSWTRNGTAKRGKPNPHGRWTGAVHLVLEPDAYTVSGGHDGCIWAPFPVTARPGRRAKFDLYPPRLHDSLGLPESCVLLAQQSCCLLELGRGIVECFLSVLTPRDSCRAGAGRIW